MSHRSVGIVQNSDIEIRPDSGCTSLKTSRKMVLDNPAVCVLCVSAVCLSYCRFSRELLSGVSSGVATGGEGGALAPLLKFWSPRDSHRTMEINI